MCKIGERIYKIEERTLQNRGEKNVNSEREPCKIYKIAMYQIGLAEQLLTNINISEPNALRTCDLRVSSQVAYHCTIYI